MPEFARAFRYQAGAVVQTVPESRGVMVERAIWPDVEEEDCADWTLTEDEYQEIVSEYESKYHYQEALWRI
jgi:hypothetical protein